MIPIMAGDTSRSRQSTIVILLCVLLAASCSTGLVKTLKDLNAIRQHLIQKYHDEVGVNLTNSKFLSIVFVNSPLNKMDDAARAERAQEAALFVSRNYEGIKSIQAIWISFVATETHFIFFHKTEGMGAFGFTRDGKPLPGSGGENDPLASVAKFSTTGNQTDISVTRIQLEGNMDEGVALVPHFTVSGDARQSTAPAPEYVILDFAFYSRQPVFTKNPDLEIACDDRSIVKGPAQLMPSSASGSDESIAQFLTVRISFKSFSRMAGAQKVRINLGAKRFDLKPEDIDALSRMAAYVTPPSAGAGG